MPKSAVLTTMCAVFLCMVMTAPHAKAAINCGVISENLAPCLGFLENGGGPTAACCNGVRTLKSITTTTDDRRTACRCMKSAAAALPSINHANTAALPSKCGISVGGPVSPQTDCSKIN